MQADARFSSRVAARLARLPQEVLASLCAQVMVSNELPDMKEVLASLCAQASNELPNNIAQRRIDACCAEHDPLPAWAVSDVLLSPDLLPHIFAHVEMKEHLAALACTAWRDAWRATDDKRRGLRFDEIIQLPAEFYNADGRLREVSAMAEHPSGDWSCMAIDGKMFIVDSAFQILKALDCTAFCVDATVSEDRIFISSLNPPRVISLDVNGFAQSAEHTLQDGDLGPDVPALDGYAELVVAPNHSLFAVFFASEADDQSVVMALDTRDLRKRFHFGGNVFTSVVYGMALVEDTLCVGEEGGWLHFFSLTGEHLRKMAPLGSDPRFHILGMASPLNIRYFGGRLYITERFPEQPDIPAGQRILVFTPEGERLQVFRHRDEDGALVPDVSMKNIAVVGSRLLVLARTPSNAAGALLLKLFALKGL